MRNMKNLRGRQKTILDGIQNLTRLKPNNNLKIIFNFMSFMFLMSNRPAFNLVNPV